MPAEGGIAKFVQEDAERDYLGYPDTVPRRVTDAPCCFLLSVCLLLVGLIQFRCAYKGNPIELGGLPDYNGKFCGVSTVVVDKPFLYFCLDGIKAVRKNRICVQECHVAHHLCPGGGSSTFYSTRDYAGLLCMPNEQKLRRQLNEIFLKDWDVFLYLAAVAFSRAWPAIFLAVVVAIVLAFLFLCLVSRCRRPLVVCSLVLIIVSMVTFSLFLLEESVSGADNIADTGDERVSFVAGITMLFLACCVMFVSVVWRKHIHASIACIKAGAECIWDSPSIAFWPFVHLAAKLSLLVAMFYGLLRLLTWLSQDKTGHAGESSVPVPPWLTAAAPLFYQAHSWIDSACILFYLLVCNWVLAINDGLSLFATSYASQVWFFTPYDREAGSKPTPAFATCKGYAVALRYHLPTVIYAGLAIPVARPLRMLMGGLFHNSTEEEEEQRNPPAAKLMRACPGCYNVYDGMLKYMAPYAYMDVALNGGHFCKAAYFSTSMMEKSAVRFFSANGASWLVTLIGQCLIAVVGGIYAYMLCTSGYFLGELGVHNSQNDFYIPHPSVMGFLAAAVCWSAASPFLTLPGWVADNVLFCHAVERKRMFQNPLKTAVRSTGMLGRLRACTGRSRQTEEGDIMRVQPPATRTLLEEARHDASMWG